MRSLYTPFLLFVFILAGCFQGDNDSLSQPGGIPIPAGFQSLPEPGNLSVKVFIEGESAPRFTNDNIDIDSDEIHIEFIAPEGEHNFIVIFEYIDLEFPRNDGNPWELARWTSDPVTVVDGEPLALQVVEYERQDFDGDEFSNADELSARTNPGNPDDVPILVTATAGTGGSISPAVRFVRPGSSATFTVTPTTGHSASIGGTCGGTLNGDTFITDEVTAACTVSATFGLTGYPVAATAGPNGSIDPPERIVNHGSTTTFTVTPDTGYAASIGGTCGGALSGNTYTTNVITDSCTVSATFSLNSYTVSTNAGTGGFINPASLVVSHGSTATFTVFLAQGFSFDEVSVTGCGGTLAGNVYTTGVVTEDCTVSATFRLNEYAVSATAGTGGSISPGSRIVEYGSTTTFTVTPDTGHSASIGGTCGGTLDGVTYTTHAITADCTVTAAFSLNEYLVTATAGEGGSISPADVRVSHGSTTTFTVTPDPGNRAIVGGTCGGTLSGTTYTTQVLTADCTVNASFSLIVPPDGIWRGGTEDQSAPGMIAILHGNRIVMSGGDYIYDGVYDADTEGGFTGTVNVFAKSGDPLKSSTKIAISGNRLDQASLMVFIDAVGNVIQPQTINFSPDSIYERDSALALVARTWGLATDQPRYNLTFPVNSNGTITSAFDSNGCRYTGSVGILDTRFNVYSVTLRLQDLLRRACVPFTGSGYTGYAALIPDDNTLHIMVSNKSRALSLVLSR